jgi:hypothetical protein
MKLLLAALALVAAATSFLRVAGQVRPANMHDEIGRSSGTQYRG